MDALARHNAARLAQWGADLDAMLSLCMSGAVAGDGEQKTALVHALFWKKWWAYAS